MTKLIEKILNSNYSDLFTNNRGDILRKYREYVKEVHPDICKAINASEAFKRLTELKNEALLAVDKGLWFEKDTRYYSLITGQTLKIRYLYYRKLDVCEYLVSRNRLLYVFDKTTKKYFDNYKNIFDNWPKNINNELLQQLDIILPQDIKYYTTTNDEYIISIKKTDDVFPLRAVVENYWKNDVPDKHLAWITSRLMHINTLINHLGYVINGIDIDTCFINCKYHTISIYGGWWFATKIGAHMLGTTKSIFNIMPPKVKANKISNTLTDTESIKLLLRSLATNCHKELRIFYNGGSLENPHEEWKKWDDALHKTFGERKFIKIEPTEKEVYLKEI